MPDETRPRALSGFSTSKAPEAALGAKSVEELEEMVNRENRRKNRKAHLTPFSDIPPERIQWLWPGRLALGKLSIFAGDPGLGKSQGSLDVSSRLSNGRPFPDGEEVPVFSNGKNFGDSVILTSEDDPADTIRPRLDALGADVRRIHFLKCKLTGGKETSIAIPDVGLFQDVLEQVEDRGGKVRLIVVDPIDGYLGGSDGFANAEVRSLLSPLLTLAAKEHFAVLGIQHLNKSGASAIYRLGGSIAFAAVARSVWIFCRDPLDEDRRLFLCLKNNLAKDEHRGIEYTVEELSGGAPLITWGRQCADDVRDVLSPGPAKRSTVAPMQDAVLQHLQGLGPSKSGAIAEFLGVSAVQSVTNVLGKLRDKGLVRPVAPYGTWEAVSESTKAPKPLKAPDGDGGGHLGSSDAL